MTWVAVAVAGAGIAGAAISSSGAKSAANTQADAANNATALQQSIYNDTVARNAPFVQGGTQQFNALLGQLPSLSAVPTAEDVMNQPGYQFGLTQGQNQLDRMMNARGMSYSGAQLKAAQRYGTDYASTKYQQAFSDLMGANQQKYNQLMGVAGLGQQAANNTSAYGSQFGAQAGNNMMGAANAQGAAGIASGNAWTNALNQGASAYQTRQTGSAWQPAANSGSWGSTGAGSQGWGSGDAYGNQDLGQYLG